MLVREFGYLQVHYGPPLVRALSYFITSMCLWLSLPRVCLFGERTCVPACVCVASLTWGESILLDVVMGVSRLQHTMTYVTWWQSLPRARGTIMSPWSNNTCCHLGMGSLTSSGLTLSFLGLEFVSWQMWSLLIYWHKQCCGCCHSTMPCRGQDCMAWGGARHVLLVTPGFVLPTYFRNFQGSTSHLWLFSTGIWSFCAKQK